MVVFETVERGRGVSLCLHAGKAPSAFQIKKGAGEQGAETLAFYTLRASGVLSHTKVRRGSCHLAEEVL